MSKEATTAEFGKQMGLTSAPNVPLPKTADLDDVISVLAEKFNVNYTPMKYRLQELNLVSRELSLEEYFVNTGVYFRFVNAFPYFFTSNITLFTTKQRFGAVYENSEGTFFYKLQQDYGRGIKVAC